MSKRKAKPLKSRDMQGLKYVERLLPHLDQLHEVGCQCDKAGNRSLHYDQYCLLALLFLFNPVVRSIRALQQASRLKNVQRKLGCARASLGSLSEAVEVFDPQQLCKNIESLAAEVKPVRDVHRGHTTQVLTAVDGSVVKTLKSIAEGVFMSDKNGDSHGGSRLHTHFDVDRQVPNRIEVNPGSNSGRNDEKNRLRAALQPDHYYVMDRWFAQYTLQNEIVAAGSSYVCRIRDNSNLDAVVEEYPVSAAAAAASVLRDVVVDLGATAKRADRLSHRVPVILLKTTPHTKRGGRKGGTAGPSSDGVLRIATNLLCTHPQGIEIQAYCAIIACLLISLWTSRKPTLRTYEMICLYFAGWASLEKLLEHINSLKDATV